MRPTSDVTGLATHALTWVLLSTLARDQAACLVAVGSSHRSGLPTGLAGQVRRLRLTQDHTVKRVGHAPWVTQPVNWSVASVRDRKRLWGRSGSRCAFPDCRQELIEETADGQGDVLVGQEAHIVAEAPMAPRGKSNLTLAQRNSYENLILLCSRHHIIIDNDVAAYPVDKLLGFKVDHELWVRRQLDTLLVNQAVLGRTVRSLTSGPSVPCLTGGRGGRLIADRRARMPAQTMEQLVNLGLWMLGIIWPGTLPELERAFSNFHCVRRDFMNVFDQEADCFGPDGSRLSAIASGLDTRAAPGACQAARSPARRPDRKT